MSDKPSGPKWETDHCKKEADGEKGAGPSRARVTQLLLGTGLSAPARDRALIPKGGLKLGSGKLRLLQEIARADEVNWQNLRESLTKAEEDGSIKQDLIDDLSRAKGSRRGISKVWKPRSNASKMQRMRTKAISKPWTQGSYMREVERRNPVRPSKAVKVLKSVRLPRD